MKKCLFLYGKHNIIDLFNSHPSKINLHGQWIALKNQLLENNIELVSKDSINLNSPDLELHLNAQNTKNFKWPKFVILVDADFIDPNNSNINLLKKYDHIFSWNPELVSLGLATKIQLSHPMGEGIIDGYKRRKLLAVLFGSNRSLRGWHPKHNLYSERVKTIKWFEHHAPKDFELYGKKWNMSGRLPTRFGGFIHSLEKRLPFKYCPFPSWKGEIINKQEILTRSRFSIVYENVKCLKGYISEKIFDAFVAGNVPVYWGAEDVDNYIPKECFIDRRNFINHEKLFNFLKNMPEDQYLNYQRCIKNFIENPSNEFTCKKFADTVSLKIIETMNKNMSN
ncbi:glycosyltransferase family 10 domain-containing protein [Candidatus Pelagibacter bacterium nBUS_28]|uniref:glycosyltransferase family 10 domain-containing protein n=1 Tax=Candidatus Pelagibacter bacterium nBUS_28 TaxID=3374189 RepID=UPI003EB7F0BD